MSTGRKRGHSVVESLKPINGDPCFSLYYRVLTAVSRDTGVSLTLALFIVLCSFESLRGCVEEFL